MSNIKFASFADEKKVANVGGVVSQNYKGKTAVLSLTSPWVSKDTKSERTSKGSLGVNTSEGWLNASALIAYLETVTGEVKTKLIKEVKNGTKKHFELVIDPSFSIKITFDTNGVITKVEK